MAKGNVNLAATTQINGDLYHGGAYNGLGTVSGMVYNYAPHVQRPAHDFEYWLAQSNDQSWGNPVATFTFRSDGTVVIQDFMGVKNLPTTAASGVIFIVEGKAVLVGDNNPASVLGKVKGHVTVVASTIAVVNSLVYANGTNQSDASDSLGLVAWYPIEMVKDDPLADRMVVTATFWPFNWDPLVCNMIAGSPILNGGSGRVFRWLNQGPGGPAAARLTLIGATPTGTNRVCDTWRVQGGHACLNVLGACAFPNTVPIFTNKDSGMSKYPPPGFPHRCIILSYKESAI